MALLLRVSGILALLLLGSACATTTATSVSGGMGTVTDDRLPVSITACPPTAGEQPLERNLTVPFSERVYLLQSGSLCRPHSTSFQNAVIVQ